MTICPHPDRRGRAAGQVADDERADPAGASVKGSEAGGWPYEEGKRVDGEREQQPAEQANASETR